jgi:hypothetical protein
MAMTREPIPSKPADSGRVADEMVEAAREAYFNAANVSDGVFTDVAAMRAAISAALAAQGQGEPIGEAGSMPGTGGFTMACFRAEDVPVGTKIYANPAPPASPAGVPGAVVRVAQHMAMAIEYIEKAYPDAAQLDRGPIMRNLRRWRDRLLAAAPSAPEGDGGAK